MFRRPEPCSSAGAPRSVAVLVRNCFTNAGVGEAPPCDLPVGLDDQVPRPRPSRVPTRWFRRLSSTLDDCALEVHAAGKNRGLASQEAKLRSPGATRLMVRAENVKPA